MENTSKILIFSKSIISIIIGRIWMKIGVVRLFLTEDYNDTSQSTKFAKFELNWIELSEAIFWKTTIWIAKWYSNGSKVSKNSNLSAKICERNENMKDTFLEIQSLFPRKLLVEFRWKSGGLFFIERQNLQFELLDILKVHFLENYHLNLATTALGYSNRSKLSKNSQGNQIQVQKFAKGMKIWRLFFFGKFW